MTKNLTKNLIPVWIVAPSFAFALDTGAMKVTNHKLTICGHAHIHKFLFIKVNVFSYGHLNEDDKESNHFLHKDGDRWHNQQ